MYYTYKNDDLKVDLNNLDEFKSFSENCETEKDEFNDDKLNKILDCTENDLKLDSSEKNNL